jgi:hypothetical protein
MNSGQTENAFAAAIAFGSSFPPYFPQLLTVLFIGLALLGTWAIYNQERM